jgi:UDP-N-acetylglucosamine 2-epimerase (non-hydrolysing)
LSWTRGKSTAQSRQSRDAQNPLQIDNQRAGTHHVGVTMTPLTQKTIHLIAAARPNFMKVAPLYHQLARAPWCSPEVVHTGQHYDTNMSDAFFVEFGLPQPTHHLEIGSGTHAQQTGRTMIAYEAVCMHNRPDAIIVVGDVNATVACALVGAKLCIPVVHLEAGLRSRDRSMPEEINRLVTDAIADLLWTPSPDADLNLLSEGVGAGKIDCIGNIMIDTFEMLRPKIERADARQHLGFGTDPYAVVTLHRPSNVDQTGTLATLVQVLLDVSKHLPLVFAVHPRTRKRLAESALLGSLTAAAPRIQLREPLGYIDFMNLVCGCKMVITDSGGVQEETTYLGIPCATVRENTERPITVTNGTNRLLKPPELAAAALEVLAGHWPKGHRPENWDGRAAQRAARSLHQFLMARAASAPA